MASELKVGIQLYSVRDFTGDDTFKDILSQLAEFGFEGVEFAWKYGGMSPDELAAFLQSIGLSCCGLHVQLAELQDPNHLVYEYALACKSPFITTSLCGRTDEWGELVPQVGEAAAIAAGKGLQFTYHNHWHEFEKSEGVYLQDILRDQSDPEVVNFELDLGWIKKGGEEPMAYWQTYAGRVPQIHLRDFSVEQDSVCDVGVGFIDMKAVAAQARELGTQWLIYEQDTYPISAMASAGACIERVREAGVL
ncbi:MAG: TIM barrel protein [Lentisphaerae bacterium]|jgi:sugar phosphate isomerase/epimerase|nr:TIM barrel protein [Lentisphaerota bacterium]MBT5607310.1 TIM barrel protein [Lentisphaerota bacterium]MBT7055372.1 TIM barrel protein [Lentisphaerota bacterium]MBT7840970.1 TIM barrel protein [Lentisphaerota bacterium]